MKNMMIIILSLFIYSNCKVSEKNVSKTLDINAIISNQLGESYHCSDRSIYTLCYSQDSQINQLRKNILVVNKQNGEIVYGPNNVAAEVVWHNDAQLKIITFPEVIQEHQSSKKNIYYYDLIKQHKFYNEY